jgi:hypothetical protein
MRPRLVALASLLAAVLAVAAPGVANAAPRHNHGLTINATPNPILAGEGVLIYGQLRGTDIGNKPIVLYHRIAGAPRFSLVGVTRTDSHGFYEFTRAEGVVETRRSWFVRSIGHTHSRTLHEHVQALVTLAASATSTDTNHPITFTGTVTPNHRFQRVFLQIANTAGTRWHTVKVGRLDGASNYSITKRFATPGQRVVRVAFPADVRNNAGASDPVTVTVQQAQVPDFTINTSSPVIAFGQAATISGTLDQAGTTTPEPNTAVNLCSRAAQANQFTCGAATTTDANGNYSFPVMPTSNTVYVVKTVLPPKRHSARLYEGVQDLITFTPSTTSTQVGQKVTFTGTVTPDKAGDVVYLERLGKDNRFHVVEVRRVRFDSTYQFGWKFGNSGTAVFRARIPGDGVNAGAASPSATITVAPAPVATLPPGS